MSHVHEPISCRQVVEQSTDLLEGVLAEEGRAAVDAHLERCGDCTRFIEQLELTVSWAAESRSPAPSEERQQQVLELLRNTGTGGRSGNSPGNDVAEPARLRDAPQPNCLHLDAEAAQAYIEDRLPDAEQIAVLEHLVEGCAECARHCREVAFPSLADVVPVRAELRERIATESEGVAYRELLEDLLIRGWDDLEEIGVDRVHFHRWLIRRARTLTAVDPRMAVRVADLCLAIASSLDAEGMARAAMLRGYVVRKIDADFREAEKWLDKAEMLLADQGPMSLLRAKLLRMKGLTHFGQSRHQEALEVFDQAEEIYLRADEVARYGESLLDRSSTESEVLGPKAAIDRCLAASTVVEWPLFPKYGIGIGQNLSLYYADTGRWVRALQALELSRHRLELVEYSPVEILHQDWARGRVLYSAGRTQESAEVLSVTRRSFVDLGLASQAAWISFDLANSLMEIGWVDESHEVLEMMVSFFVSRRLPKESLLALQMLRHSVITHTVTGAQIRALAVLLSKAGSGVPRA